MDTDLSNRTWGELAAMLNQDLLVNVTRYRLVVPYWMPGIGGWYLFPRTVQGYLNVVEQADGWLFSHPGFPNSQHFVHWLQYDSTPSTCGIPGLRIKIADDEDVANVIAAEVAATDTTETGYGPCTCGRDQYTNVLYHRTGCLLRIRTFAEWYYRPDHGYVLGFTAGRKETIFLEVGSPPIPGGLAGLRFAPDEDEMVN